MDRNDVSWRGYWAACPTPFAQDESLALDLLRQLLDYYASQGLHGVLINGTTGEWFSQTPQERREVARTAIEHVAGRMTVVIGCTAYTATEVAELAQHAMQAGADGFASTPPPYSKTLPEETVAFYSDISRAIDAPMMVYNWPHGTSVDIGPELASRIADVETVVAIKDSTPNVAQFQETVRRVVDRVRVFGQFMSTEGYERMCLDGGDGTIGGGTLLGASDPQFWEAHWCGERDLCLRHARRIDALFPRLWVDGGWAGHWGAYQSQLKAIMAMLGQPGGTTRPPRLPISDPESLRAIREILVEEGLLDEEQGAPA